MSFPLPVLRSARLVHVRYAVWTRIYGPRRSVYACSHPPRLGLHLVCTGPSCSIFGHAWNNRNCTELDAVYAHRAETLAYIQRRVCSMTDGVSFQPYVEQAAADKTRAEKEKDEYDVRTSHMVAEAVLMRCAGQEGRQRR